MLISLEEIAVVSLICGITGGALVTLVFFVLKKITHFFLK